MRDEEPHSEVMYWVNTEGGYRMGPYEEYCLAWYSAVYNLGFEGWIISKEQANREEEQ